MAYDLKSESEVQEYIKNLGIEYRFGCYSEKNPEVCHLLGDYLEAVKKDFAKACKVYKSNCDEHDYGQSCHTYASYSFIGKGGEKENHDTAYEYYKKGCTKGVADSCFNAGLMHLSPNTKMSQEKDLRKGIKYLDESCGMNNEYSCYYLSGIYISGIKDQMVDKDMKEAFKYSTKACELGNMYACSNLSLMYKKGEGVEKNEELSIKMKQKALEIQEQVKSNYTLEFGRGSKSSV